ncbi:hypothetical protein D9M69_396450 [compost metagenome]
MAQALHFHLTGVGEAALVDQAADTDQVLLLVSALDLMLQLVADVEVVLERTLAAASHDGNLAQAGIQGLFNAVLDQWLVHHWQHFLGHRLGGRQEACTVTSGGEQAFLDHFEPWGGGCYGELPRSLIRRHSPYNARSRAVLCPGTETPLPPAAPARRGCVHRRSRACA